MRMKGREIKKGRACASALVSEMPISFLGGIDPKTGEVIAKDSDIRGQCIAGRVLVFPTGKGSTVGSYVLLRLMKNGAGPAAIINAASEPIVSVGAIIADIPMVDGIDISKIRTGDTVCVDGDTVSLEREGA